MRTALHVLASLPLVLFAGTAQATVHVAIDLTHQRMHVVSDHGVYDWPISSARSGFTTPGGSYAPTHLELMHYSKKYDMSPMPHAIFFRGGYAIHGTYSVGSLGRPASHGCVRLSPGNATTLYNMVQAEGARISISGRPPASRSFAPSYVADRGSRTDTGVRGYDDVPAAGAAYPAYGYGNPFRYPADGYQPYEYSSAPSVYGNPTDQAAPYYGE